MQKIWNNKPTCEWQMLNVVLGKDLTLVLLVDYIVFTIIIHLVFQPQSKYHEHEKVSFVFSINAPFT